MSTITNTPDTPQLTPEAVAEQLRALIPSMPGYVHLPKATAQSLRAAAAVDPQFIDSAFAAIDASDVVRAGVGATSEDLRADADAAGRWTAVREVLREMLNGIDAAVLTRKYRVGHAALQAYSLARSVARREDQSHLLTHIATMKSRIRTGRRSKKESTPEPQPAPQQ